MAEPITIQNLAWVILTSGLVVTAISVPRFAMSANYASKRVFSGPDTTQAKKEMAEDLNKELVESAIGLLLVIIPWIYIGVQPETDWDVRIIIVVVSLTFIFILAFGLRRYLKFIGSNKK